MIAQITAGTRMMRPKSDQVGNAQTTPRLRTRRYRRRRVRPYCAPTIATPARLRTRRFRRRRRRAVPPRRGDRESAQLVAFVDEARYAAAGVDIDAGNRMVELIKPLVRATARPGADAEIGGFGGLFDLKAAGFTDPILVAATDGVGTKVKIAIETAAPRHDRHRSRRHVGQRSCRAGRRAAVLSRLFCLRQARSRASAAAVVNGVAAACREARLRADRRRDGGDARPLSARRLRPCRLCGRRGRTRDNLLPRTDIAPGDVVVGLASSGVHSNGFSLVRHIVADGRPRLGWPRRRSSRHARSAKRCSRRRGFMCSRVSPRSATTKAVKALAHITGGGFVDNIPRVLPPGLAVAVESRPRARPAGIQMARRGRQDRREGNAAHL